MACQKKVVYAIAGNKVDLVPGRSFEDARAFANSIQGDYFETSAKTGVNVREMLTFVSKSMHF